MADEYGITPEGWQSKRLADVIDEASIQLAEIVDPKTGNRLNPDFNSDDPAMQIVSVPLNQAAQGWEAAQLANDQYAPLRAIGPSVDAQLMLTGLQRKPSTPTIINVELQGTAGATVLSGQTISDIFDSNLFTTEETVTFDGDGKATTTAVSVVNGPVIVTDNTIVKIKTPQPNWDSVTNLSTRTVGTLEETDEQAELRRRQSTMGAASAPVDSVAANLLNLEGVTFARVKINNTLETNADGIPAKSQACIVQGGDDGDIARTILQRSGCTAEFVGTTEVVLYDKQGEPYPIQFSRPTQVPMTVVVDISVTNSSIYPTDAPQRIASNIVVYSVEGADAFGIVDGFDQNGFPPGVDVIVSRLYTPINQVPGHKVNSVTVNGEAGTVPIAFNELAYFDASTIAVTVS